MTPDLGEYIVMWVIAVSLIMIAILTAIAPGVTPIVPLPTS